MCRRCQHERRIPGSTLHAVTHCATRGAVTHYTPPPLTDRELREERRRDRDRDRAMNGRWIRERKDGRESWVGPMLREEAEAFLRQHSTPCRLEKGRSGLRPTWVNADARIERESGRTGESLDDSCARLTMCAQSAIYVGKDD